MPLAIVGCSVACLLEHPWQEWRLWAEPIRHVAFGIAGHPREVAVNVVACRKVACHHGRSAGRAHTAGDGKSMKICAFLRQSVDVWRLHIGMPMTAQVTPTPVVGEDKQNVGSVGSDRGLRECDQCEESKAVIEAMSVEHVCMVQGLMDSSLESSLSFKSRLPAPCRGDAVTERKPVLRQADGGCVF